MKKDKKAESAELNATEEFKGYTLNELRYQQALLLVKREFLKEKALKQTRQLRNDLPIVNGKSPLSSISPTGLVGKVIRGLSFADYLMLGFSVFTTGKKMFSLFKRKK